MRLVRVRDWNTAKMVASGVRRYNYTYVSPQRVLSRPHFTLHCNQTIAGWIGYEARGAGSYELVHLSVRPAYRHGGLAQSAVATVLCMVRAAGGKFAYTRINSRNKPSICLARKFGFRKVRGGAVSIYGRRV